MLIRTLNEVFQDIKTIRFIRDAMNPEPVLETLG